MKNVLKGFLVMMFAFTVFSFKPFDDEPKVVILDIVNNLENQNEQDVVNKFLKQIESLNQEQVKVVLWKDLTQDKTKNPSEILKAVSPDYLLTISFKESEAAKENITAVVSNSNVSKDQSLILAEEVANTIASDNIENKGVFTTDSQYAQDNEVPAVFLSVEVKNQPAVDDELASKLVEVIESVEVKPLIIEEVEETETIEIEEVSDSTDNTQAKAETLKNSIDAKTLAFKAEQQG